MERPFLPFVVLRHTFEDDAEKDHFDFLFETQEGSDPESRTLIGFRVVEPTDDGFMSTAERMEPHRRHYLTYEGLVSGGRGRVVRVREGVARVRDAGESMQICYRFEGVNVDRYAVGVHSKDGWWTFKPSTAEWSTLG